MGTLGSKYYVSYYNNQPAVPSALQDTFVPLDVKSEPFCMSSCNTHAFLHFMPPAAPRG